MVLSGLGFVIIQTKDKYTLSHFNYSITRIYIADCLFIAFIHIIYMLAGFMNIVNNNSTRRIK